MTYVGPYPRRSLTVVINEERSSRFCYLHSPTRWQGFAGKYLHIANDRG